MLYIAPIGNWVISWPNKTCNETCHQAGLFCTEEALYRHNHEVDSCRKVQELVKTLIGSELKPCNVVNGDSPAVPNYDGTRVFASSMSRSISTYSCSHRPEDSNKRRLCFCHGNYDSMIFTQLFRLTI